MAAGSVPVVTRAAALGLDLEENPFYRYNPNRVTRGDRSRAVRARSPQCVPDANHPIWVDTDLGDTHFSD
jgi:hypothetical protein